MEDSVGVEERREREQSETTPHKRARQEVSEVGGEQPGEEGGGFLSAMASKIGAAVSGANGGNASGAMETEEVKEQDVAGEQAGFLSAMATKIGMAVSGANGDGSDSHVGSTGEDGAKTSNGEANNGEEKKGEEANGSGGILSAVASKIGVAVSGANGNGNGNHSAEEDVKTSTGDAGHGTKAEEKGRDVNGGRIVEQIISKLPSDDQAPDADEASLLIHIIED